MSVSLKRLNQSRMDKEKIVFVCGNCPNEERVPYRSFKELEEHRVEAEHWPLPEATELQMELDESWEPEEAQP